MEGGKGVDKSRSRDGGKMKDGRGGKGPNPHIFQIPFLEEEDEEVEEEYEKESEEVVNRTTRMAIVTRVESTGDVNNNVDTASTNETATTDDNEENGSGGKALSEDCRLTSAESWSQWKNQFRQDFQKINNSTLPGAFAVPVDEKYFQCCKHNKFPRELAHVLRLPLRFVLCRGKLVGCTLQRSDCEMLVKEINKYWKQAGIQFFLIDEVHVSYALDKDYHGMSLYELREGINSLARGPDGKMTGKDKRRKIFLHHLMKN